LHIRLRVLLHDDVHRGRELDVAADMVAMRMSVDQRGHRLVRQFLDLVQDRLTPAGILRIHDNDAIAGDEHSRIAAAAFENE